MNADSIEAALSAFIGVHRRLNMFSYVPSPSAASSAPAAPRTPPAEDKSQSTVRVCAANTSPASGAVRFPRRYRNTCRAGTASTCLRTTGARNRETAWFPCGRWSAGAAGPDQRVFERLARVIAKQLGFLADVGLPAQQGLLEVPAFFIHFPVDFGAQFLANGPEKTLLDVLRPPFGHYARQRVVELIVVIGHFDVFHAHHQYQQPLAFDARTGNVPRFDGAFRSHAIQALAVSFLHVGSQNDAQAGQRRNDGGRDLRDRVVQVLPQVFLRDRQGGKVGKLAAQRNHLAARTRDDILHGEFGLVCFYGHPRGPIVASRDRIYLPSPWWGRLQPVNPSEARTALPSRSPPPSFSLRRPIRNSLILRRCTVA